MTHNPHDEKLNRIFKPTKNFLNNTLAIFCRSSATAMPKKQRRKLASILYADVSNYSGHCEHDEEGTHTRLIELMDLFASNVRTYQGRVAHCEGDALLAEFGQVVSVMNCALVVQQQITSANESFSPEQRIEFRIGVNMGEVICDRGDIYGNAVNIAARLENLAEPGGITVSETVRVSVGNRLAVNYIPLGEQWVKNINSSIRAYRIELQRDADPEVASENVLLFPHHSLEEPIPG